MRALRRTVRVRCAIARAFDTFTSRLDEWWPTGHRHLAGSRLTMEARVGGRFFERTDAGDEAELGEVVRWEPPRRVTYTWYPGSITEPTHVDVRFIEDGSDTVVEVVHAEGEADLGDAWGQRAKRFERAWGEVLPAFVERVIRAEI